MTTIEILFIGAALSMDAVAVTMTNGMVYRGLTKPKYVAIPIFFGAFQGIMPLAGYFAGGFFAEIISRYAGIVIFLILGIIGGKMVKEGLSRKKERHEEDLPRDLTWKVLFFQAVATSIDAFAVGVGFSVMAVNILTAAPMIAATTTVFSVLALLIGRWSGDLLGSKAEVLGGIILIFIGIKAII